MCNFLNKYRFLPRMSFHIAKNNMFEFLIVYQNCTHIVVVVVGIRSFRDIIVDHLE